MSDLLFMVLVLVFFAVAVLFVRACDLVVGSTGAESERPE